MRIGYVLKRYPRLSETFIVQEILQMERREADLVVLPIMDPGEPLRNPIVDQVRSPVVYIQRSFWHDVLRMLGDHLRLFAASPSRYRRAVRHLLASGGSPRSSLKVFLQAGRLARLAQELGVDHLHAHFAHNPTSLARYANLLTGIPFSFTAHAKDLYLSRPQSIADKAALATFITTCTGFNARYLSDILQPADRDKIRVVYHGVDTMRFRPSEMPLQNRVPAVMSVGRLVPKKGHEHVIAAAGILRERGLSFQLRVYGEGPLRAALQQQIESAGLRDLVSLEGACMQDELIPVYQRSDAFVLAPVVTANGDRDGIPNVLLEAMASGLPVVSTAISGIPEVITDEVDGLLVPPGDAGAVAAALETLLASVSLRSRLGAAARASICRNFDATDNAGTMAELLGLEGEMRAYRVRSG